MIALKQAIVKKGRICDMEHLENTWTGFRVKIQSRVSSNVRPAWYGDPNQNEDSRSPDRK